jgi:hypothetical protein
MLDILLIGLGTVLVVGAAASAIALGMPYLSWITEKNPEEIITATGEWQASGKIDFHCTEIPQDEKVPATFVLRVEDYRTVESISGVEHVELRWRNATLAEAKSVVVAHQKTDETGARGYQVPKLVRA